MSAEDSSAAVPEQKQGEIHPTKLVVAGGRIPSRSERFPELPLASYAQGLCLHINAMWKFELVLDASDGKGRLIYLEHESCREYTTVDGEYTIRPQKPRQILREIPVEWKIDERCEKTLAIRVDSAKEPIFWMRILMPTDQYWAKVLGA